MSHNIVKWYVSDTPASLHFLHCVVCSAVLESSDLVQPLLKCGKHLCLLLTPVHMWKKGIGCWRMLYLLSTCCRLMLRRLNPKHERIIPKSKISEVFQIEVYHGKSGKRWLWPAKSCIIINSDDAADFTQAHLVSSGCKIERTCAEFMKYLRAQFGTL